MADSSKAKAVEKPRADFPLFPHASGRWAKKVRGQFVYFGKTSDDPKGEAALTIWLEEKDEILRTGRRAEPKLEGLTLRDLCNRFRTAKLHKRDTGELSPHTYTDYKRVTDLLIAEFGKVRLVNDFTPADFEQLRRTLAKTYGVVSLGNRIQRIRVVFNYAYENHLIDRPVRYGSEFKRPTRKSLRVAKAKIGSKMFEPNEIKALIAKATPQLSAMIHLAVNCGFGNQDCATLTLSSIKIKKGWVHFPRPKTGVDRRCPLWPETVKALAAVLEKRKAPKEVEHSNLVFVTKRGGSWAKLTSDNPIAKEFAKLAKECELAQTGRGFYSLRHVCRTIGGGAKDQEGIRFIMGHVNEHVEETYIERIEDSRLKAVTDHIRKWLFGTRNGKS